MERNIGGALGNMEEVDSRGSASIGFEESPGRSERAAEQVAAVRHDGPVDRRTCV